MIEIDFRSTIERASANLTNLDRKQLPFASALAITRTAQDAQTKVQRNLPRRFVIRNKWVSGGIRIKPGIKTSARRSVIVYSRDDYMVLQEEGGVKTPTGKMLAVPAGGVPRTARGIIRKRDRPRNVLERYGVFIAPLTAGAGKDKAGVFKREARRRKRKRKYSRPAKARPPIRLLYVLIPKARVKARFGMRELVRSAVTRNWPRRFKEALAHARATAR